MISEIDLFKKIAPFTYAQSLPTNRFIKLLGSNKHICYKGWKLFCLGMYVSTMALSFICLLFDHAGSFTKRNF